MAVPTVQGGFPGVATTVSPQVVSLPSGMQAGDVMVIVVEDGRGACAVDTAGWVAFPDSPQDPLADTELNAFWKRWDGSETTVTISGYANHALARTFAIRGCPPTGNPFDVTAGNTNGGASSATVTFAGDTTTVDECLIVMMAADGVDASGGRLNDGTLANADLTNLLELSDTGTTSGNGGGLIICSGEKAVAGAFAATTGTYASARRYGALTIAFKPDPAAGAGFVPKVVMM